MKEDVLERANSFASELNEADRQRRIRDLGALHLIHALAAEVRELRKDRELLAEIAKAPFPLHDYCSQEAWTRACHIVAELDAAMKERSDGVS